MRWLKDNFAWKALALAIAVLLWIAVASEPELSTFLSVPVEFKNMPDDLDISSEIVETVFLETHGPSGRLRELGDSGAAVVLDFSTVRQAGERTFAVSRDNVSVPRGIELVRAIPAQLRFRFERRLFKTVPVEVRFSGGPPAGYRVVDIRAQPAVLNVVGPESSVVRTSTAVTDPIDLGSVVGTAKFRVNTFLTERQARFQAGSLVSVRVTVRKTK